MSMRRLLLLVALAGSLAIAADHELTGRVVDADTGEPIARAHVTVHFFQAGQPSPEVTLLTDIDGTFRMTNMPNGGFQISCEKPGYLPVNQGGGAPVNARGSQSIPNMVVKMTAQAALEGTVVDENDIPAADTFIQLVHQQVLNGRKQLQIAQGGGTDETGHFRVFGLSAGRYYISIAPRLTGARRRRPLAYPPLYYPSALDMATAQPIDLKAGDEMQIKVQLPAPIPAFTISGTVATAAPNVGVMLVREPIDQNMQQAAGDDITVDLKTKTFRIAHVPPGMYLLKATAQDGKSSWQASTTLSVGGSDVTGLRLEPVDIALDGMVRIDGSGQTQQRPGGFVSVQSDHSGNGGQVDADGKFHIPGLQADTYRILPQMYGQQCVRSVLQSGRDVRDGLTIAPGAAPDPIEIVLSAHCGTVDVTLTPPDGPMPANLMAYLLRKSKEEYVLEKQGFMMAGNGAGSPHFMIPGVAPGDYVVFIWAQETPIEYTNAEYMRQFESYGQPVSVSDDGTATVTVDKILTLPVKN
jgi:Carboxypeptidase regulatory-like domain